MREGVATQEELDEIKNAVLASYEKDFEVWRTYLVLILDKCSAVRHHVSTCSNRLQQ